MRLLCLAAAVSTASRTAEARVLGRVHSPDEILRDHVRIEGPFRIFTDAAGRSWDLVGDVDDPAIRHKGSGAFHTAPVPVILEALAEVTGPFAELEVEIYVLPFPRRELLASSADGSAIYLSPGVQPWSEEQVHALVVHELGHVVQHQFLPGGDPGWHDYLRLRHITDETLFTDHASHRNRPREIFAEDFRALFGGSRANYSGSIENSDLAHPFHVDGLFEFFTAIAAAADTPASPLALESAPNPFRPRTTIRFVVPSGRHEARLDVISVEGRLVRGLLKEPLEGGEHLVTWDGRDNSGREVAAGVYFARVVSGGESAVIRVVRTR